MPQFPHLRSCWMSMLHFCSAARQHVLGMTQDKRDSVSPVGIWSVGVESEWWVAVWGEARESVGRNIFLPLS